MTFPWYFQALIAFLGPFITEYSLKQDLVSALILGGSGLVAFGTNKGVKTAQKGKEK